ncbi:MAG: hypothetical protein LAP85_17975 [Acidobacteriia bacterium]|nr:hypothetical protein [Terriglobia bacterium]
MALIRSICPGPSWAAEARFERLGPYGGTVRSLLISTKDSRVVYMGTSDGQLFQSADGGVSWHQLYPGIGRRQLVIDTIVEDPANVDHLYAGGWDLRSNGGGLFETRDAGTSWNQVKLPKANVAVRGFAVSKGNPSHMIAGTGGGVFVTADGGKTWQQRGARMDAFLQAESVAIDPVDPRIVFVGTWHLGYRSTDFGKTWVQNDRGMILDSDVFSISIDDRNPKNVFASACTGLYRSVDHGATWTRLKVFPKSYLVRAQIVYIDPTRSECVYGGTTEGLFLSPDSGRTWSRVTASDLTIHAVQVDPRNGSVILLGTESHGVLRSEDGGRSWKESNTGFVTRSITRIVQDPTAPGRFLVGEVSEGKLGGYFIYDNPLNAWARLDEKEMPGEGLLALLMLPGDGGRIAGTARGAFLQRPGSSEWSGLPGPISKLAVYDLAVYRDKSWVFAGTNDGIYRARLDDLNFQKPPNYSIIPRAFSLMIPHSGPDRIFAGTHMGVLCSSDSGDTWKFASNGIPDHTIVQCLVFSPADAEHLFAGTSAGLYESRNGGNTWQRVADGRLGVDISSVIFLDAGGTIILAADNTSGGVFLSENGGMRWEKIGDPEFGSPVRSLAQDPSHPAIIYLGTASEGVYRLTLQTSGIRPPVSDPVPAPFDRNK